MKTVMNGTDLTTAEGMLTFASFFGERVREQFNEDQEATALVGVVATWNAEAQANFEQPTGLVLLMPDLTRGPTFAAVTDKKREGAGFVRFLVRESKAIGVVSAMEIWISDNEKYRNRDFAEDPERREAIMVIAEHIRLKEPYLVQAKITRNALGRGTAGPFVDPYAEQKARGARLVVKGRFADLLQRTRFA